MTKYGIYDGYSAYKVLHSMIDVIDSVRFDISLEWGATFITTKGFRGCDFSTAHLRGLTEVEDLTELSFNGYFYQCSGVVVSPDPYGECGRVVAVNDTGYIFIGCATFDSLENAVKAVADKYGDCDMGYAYVQGVRETFAKAQALYGF